MKLKKMFLGEIKIILGENMVEKMQWGDWEIKLK